MQPQCISQHIMTKNNKNVNRFIIIFVFSMNNNSFIENYNSLE